MMNFVAILVTFGSQTGLPAGKPDSGYASPLGVSVFQLSFSPLVTSLSAVSPPLLSVIAQPTMLT